MEDSLQKTEALTSSRKQELFSSGACLVRTRTHRLPRKAVPNAPVFSAWRPGTLTCRLVAPALPAAEKLTHSSSSSREQDPPRTQLPTSPAQPSPPFSSPKVSAPPTNHGGTSGSTQMAAAPLSLTYTPPAAPLPSWLSYTSAPTLTTTAFYTLPTLLSGSPSLLTASVVLTQWGTEIIQLPLTVEAPSGIVLGFPYTEVGGEGPTVVRVLGETGVFTLGDSGVRLFGSAEVVETGAVGTVGATGTGVEAGVSVTETSGATTLASGSGGTGVALTSAAATAGTMSGSSGELVHVLGLQEEQQLKVAI